MTTAPDQRAQEVVVVFRNTTWALVEQTKLAFGRGSDCEIRICGDEDTFVSRNAGSFHLLDDYVLIANDSTVHPLVVRPPRGEDLVVEPGGAVTTRPHAYVTVVITGAGGRTYHLLVDAHARRGVRPGRQGTDSQPGHRSDGRRSDGQRPGHRTEVADVPLTPTQLRVVSALAEPLLRRSDHAAGPATYHEIAAKLGLKPEYVRRVVSTVRQAAGASGLPGVTADDPGADPDRYRWELARWALRRGLVGNVHQGDDEGG